MTSVATGERATAEQAETSVDLVVAGGLARIRLVGVRASDRAATESQFGAAVAVTRDPADITVHYRDDVGLRGPLRYLGPDQLGFTDDGFVVLAGRFRHPVRVRLPIADLGGRCEVVCQHGVGRVPHLVSLVNLAVLANGGLALHASAFDVDGTATVATGWSKGGKTEALLAACQRGARYVGDEWLHLAPDGRVHGIEEPVRVWDWHLDQLPTVRAALAPRDRARLTALRWADRSVRATRRSERLATAIARQRFVDAPASLVGPHGRAPSPLPLGPVFLMTSADRPGTLLHRISGSEVAERMAASLTFERSPLHAVVIAHRYAFPGVVARAFEEVPAVERDRLHALLDHADAAEIVHPYPVDLARLADALWIPKERWT